MYIEWTVLTSYMSDVTIIQLPALLEHWPHYRLCIMVLLPEMVCELYTIICKAPFGCLLAQWPTSCVSSLSLFLWCFFLQTVTNSDTRSEDGLERIRKGCLMPYLNTMIFQPPQKDLLATERPMWACLHRCLYRWWIIDCVLSTAQIFVIPFFKLHVWINQFYLIWM